MSRQLSTSLSDFVLAVSCALAVRQLTAHTALTGTNFNYANAGFMLILASAGLGAVRYGMSSPPSVLVQCHKYTSQYLAAVVGLCCLAAEFYEQAGLHAYGQLHLYASLVVLLVQLTVKPHKMHALVLVADAVSAGAAVSMFAVCAVSSIDNRRFYGCVGSVTIVVLSLVVRFSPRRGRLGILPVVDLFHYGFVAVNYCLTRALVGVISSKVAAAASAAPK